MLFSKEGEGGGVIKVKYFTVVGFSTDSAVFDSGIPYGANSFQDKFDAISVTFPWKACGWKNTPRATSAKESCWRCRKKRNIGLTHVLRLPGGCHKKNASLVLTMEAIKTGVREVVILESDDGLYQFQYLYRKNRRNASAKNSSYPYCRTVHFSYFPWNSVLGSIDPPRSNIRSTLSEYRILHPPPLMVSSERDAMIVPTAYWYCCTRDIAWYLYEYRCSSVSCASE